MAHSSVPTPLTLRVSTSSPTTSRPRLPALPARSPSSWPWSSSPSPCSTRRRPTSSRPRARDVVLAAAATAAEDSSSTATTLNALPHLPPQRACAAVAGCGSRSSPPGREKLPDELQGGRLERLGERIDPELRFTDHTGAFGHDGEVGGDVLTLTLNYYTCETLCTVQRAPRGLCAD